MNRCHRQFCFFLLALLWGLIGPPLVLADRSWPLTTASNPLPLLPPGKPGRLVFGVMGSSHIEQSLAPSLARRLDDLGQIIASQGDVLLTGACPGMPLMVARSAKRFSGWVVGISAAGTLEEHITQFHSPIEAHDVIQLTGAGSGMGFIAREKLNIQTSDILIFVGGRTGTLSEILFAMEEGKVIALLRESTGITAVFEQQILPLIGRAKGIFVADQDPRRLIEKAVAAYRGLQRGSAQPPRGTAVSVVPKVPAALRAVMVSRSPLTLERARRDNIYALFTTRRGMSPADLRAVKQLISRLSEDRSGGRRPLLVMATRGPRSLTAELAALAQHKGLLTLGLSPAKTPEEHLAGGYATAGFDQIFLCGEGEGAGRLAVYLHGLKNADAVFVAGGDHLTLGGTLSAMYQAMVVAVLETGGMSGKLRTHILSAINKQLPAQMIYDTAPRTLVARAVAAALVMRRAGKRSGHIAE